MSSKAGSGRASGIRVGAVVMVVMVVVEVVAVVDTSSFRKASSTTM